MHRRRILSTALARAGALGCRARIASAQDSALRYVDMHSHIGVLGGSTVIHGYEQFAQIAERLARRGMGAEDVAGIMGENYLRVLGQALRPA